MIRDVGKTGKEAARLVLERLRNPAKPPSKVLLPTSLVLRDSTFEIPPRP